MKTLIHVHQQRLKKNLPPIIIRTYKGVEYASEVSIEGPSKIIWQEKPLDCGARCWISTESKVTKNA